MTPISEFFLMILYFLISGAHKVGKVAAHRFLALPLLFAFGWAVTFSPLSLAELVGYSVMIFPVIFFVVGVGSEILSDFNRKRKR